MTQGEAAEQIYGDTRFMFSKLTEYGRLRLDLLDFLIEWYKKKASE